MTSVEADGVRGERERAMMKMHAPTTGESKRVYHRETRSDVYHRQYQNASTTCWAQKQVATTVTLAFET